MRRDFETKFKPQADSFSRVPLSVNVPKDIDAAVRSMSNWSAWLRWVITETAQRELMKGDALSLPKGSES